MKWPINLKLGAALISFLIFVCLLSFFYTPYPPNEESGPKYQAPTLAHPLGTDDLGRDVLSRLMLGTRTVFAVGVISVSIGLIGGVVLGSAAGFLGGVSDEFIMRLMDAMMSFPGILFALMYVAVFGYGIVNTMIALGIMAIPVFARVTRSGVMQQKNLTYIDLARSVGVGRLRILYAHILPNLWSSLIVAASLGFASAILAEAGLSYLGLGVQPPQPSWGRMLKESQASFFAAPHYSLMPGLMITIAVLGFNLLGDGLRDWKDGRRR